MATIKSYTSVEQSRKLAEFLPIESADMWYQHTGISIKDGSEKPIYFPMVIRDCESDEDILAWSLAALLKIIGHYTLQTVSKDKKVFIVSEENYPICSDSYSEPVDACVTMIERLHKLKML